MLIKRPAPVKGKTDVILVTDMAGFADRCDQVNNQYRTNPVWSSGPSWWGGKPWGESVAHVRGGDLAGVEASDKFMAAIEVDNLVSQSWEETHDVIGGVPNVPAYLAGLPLNMRRMERVADERGPLTMFASLELSASIDVGTMRKRGAAVLALVRALSATRPVELYACCSIGEGSRHGNDGFGSHVLIRIDTAPLDLARAAHVLTCPSVTRLLGYSMLTDQADKELTRGKGWNGQFAYGDVHKYRETARDNFVSIVSPGSDSLWLPAAHATDPCVKEPVRWLKGMIRQFGGLTEE